MSSNTRPQRQKCRREHLEREELAIYNTLKEVWGHKRPLKLVWYMFNAELLLDGTYRVPSYGKEREHIVDLEKGTCSKCEGFDIHNSCSHLTALALRSRMEHRKPKTTTNNNEPEFYWIDPEPQAQALEEDDDYL